MAAYEMSDEEKKELVAEFLSESEQHLQNLNDGLLKAEEFLKAGKGVSADNINMMFRAAHTIKGTASMLGFTTLSSLTHEMETLMDRVRNGKMELSLAIVDVLFMAFDTLNSILTKLKEQGTDAHEIQEAVSKIKAVLSGNEAPAAAAAAPAPAPAAPAAAPSAGAPVDYDTRKYLNAFIEDAEQGVARFNELLVSVETEKFDVDHLNELFRISHTLKGSAGIVKCAGIESVAHRMEDILSDLREKGARPSADVCTLLYRGIDWIRAGLEKLKKGKSDEEGLKDFLADFGKAQADSPAEEASTEAVAALSFAAFSKEEKTRVLASIKNHETVYRVVVTIGKGAGVKSLKALLVEERLKRSGILIKARPSIDQIRDDRPEDLQIEYLHASALQENDLKASLSIADVNVVSIEREEVMDIKPQVTAAPAAPKEAASPKAASPEVSKEKAAGGVDLTTMRVDSRKLDNLMNLAGELVITRARFAQLVNEFSGNIFQAKSTSVKIQELESQLGTMKASLRKLLTSQESGQAEESQKVLKLLDQMEGNFRVVSEGISLKEVGAKVYNLDEATSSLGKLSSDIQSAVMQTRMVPIEGVFTRFKRVVRDISKDLGKEIDLEIYGEETELDKKIIDSLSDPLTHMVRNAIDHGIESKDERIKAGKRETGKVVLRAAHRGNNICIDISDDGKGLDAEKICAKAVEKGVVSREKADKMTEKEKLSLIFLPGFSTAEKVTGLSGRGVGMDVVKKMIESLNGLVEIETEVGKGTTFVLKIPLTLAIIQALLVVIGNEVFAVPLESVSEIVKVKSREIYSVDGGPTIKLRGHALSLVDLEKVLQVEGKESRTESERRVVVITDGNQLVGMTVDRLIGEDEIVIKALPDYFSSVKGISGASILGDGRIALILDVGTIIREA